MADEEKTGDAVDTKIPGQAVDDLSTPVEKPAETKQEPPEPAAEKTAEEKAADAASAKPKEPETPAKVIPEKYDLKLPEGSQLDEGAVERVSTFAKENKLTQEEAQARLDHDSEAVKTFNEGAEARLTQQSDAWIEETKKDPEIGGDKFNESAELAKRVITRFAPDTLKDALNSTGLGNHPGLVKMLVNIGKGMSEDSLVLPGAQAPAGQEKSLADTLYGETSAQENK